MSAPSPVFVGIDVSKDALDVFISPSGESLRVANDTQGCRKLIHHLQPLGVSMVVIEATGRFDLAWRIERARMDFIERLTHSFGC